MIGGISILAAISTYDDKQTQVWLRAALQRVHMCERHICEVNTGWRTHVSFAYEEWAAKQHFASQTSDWELPRKQEKMPVWCRPDQHAIATHYQRRALMTDKEMCTASEPPPYPLPARCRHAHVRVAAHQLIRTD